MIKGINMVAKSSWVYSPLCLGPPHHAGLGNGFTEDTQHKGPGLSPLENGAI